MTLHPLCSAPHVEIYYDTFNNWLFIDWEGDLTLDIVQRACLEIARCYQQYAYPRVLNSNAQVTSFALDVAAWLASEFIPNLGVIGVEQVAWVVAPTVQGQNGVIDTVKRLPETSFNLFDDVASAVAWLQQIALPPSREGAPGLTAQSIERIQLIDNLLKQHVLAPPVPA
ncbi:MAG: hypothetical protein EOO55_03295 [Hymenobacter sp.]|nr:MAG: hypothetical protein EOO55_03295 [Hymenobacter sp.]